VTYLLGIDLGTSSVKVVAMDESGRVDAVASREYPILTPQPGYAEQRPDDWWNATCDAVREVVNHIDHERVRGIGFSGQMHGTVIVNADGSPLRNAIIWADQRSTAEVDELIAQFGAERLAQTAGTLPATGFMVSSLLWLKKHGAIDPLELDGVYAVLPKDYVRNRMCGGLATEITDASSSGLFDVRDHHWIRDITALFEGHTALDFPNVLRPEEIAGTLHRRAAEQLGLPEGIPVAAGCADQVAQALGNGLIDPGQGSVTIGTGGQVFAVLDSPRAVPQLHTFCHAPKDRWYMLGAMLSAGLSLRWLRDLLGMTGDPAAYEQLSALAAEVPAGADGLYFLPYLIGERAPLLDPRARGVFMGLTLRHGRGHMARAIMEGVAFALRQIIEVMEEQGVAFNTLIASGNGLSSPLWRQIAADVLGKPLVTASGGERAGIGAAMLGGIAAGIYTDYHQARRIVPPVGTATEPDQKRAAFYSERYAQFRKLYPLLRESMHSAD
jgi:xylulokinase